ncbi:uncharacterized protein L203_104368 [Cryptococcus depauperatus CBS 7841]|uniref:PinX1-related protein 1 n=1 Tax=Cryptococcus depauperatus CBS 7841 TaxID=1295531 RepID=A0A1E3IG01_9TREE|nr:Pin2-interacting protein X1 [Cryptococcus depauperatus CBS 7841]
MGLSERKVKQRIGLDPRNLGWSDDKNRFSYKHMKNLGWQDNSGLGSTFTGNANHIAVVRKVDNGGIGITRARKEGNDMAAGAGQAGQGLEEVLRRLASASATPIMITPEASPSPTTTPFLVPEEKPAVVRNKIASRQRHLLSKKMASQSPQALAEILGVPVSSLPASPSPLASESSTPQPENKIAMEESIILSGSGESLKIKEKEEEEMITTSKVSVADYFRQRMREKILTRQGVTAATPSTSNALPKHSLEKVQDNVKRVIGSSAWEGSKMTFSESEVQEEQTVFNPSESTGAIPKECIEKEKKRQRKEENRSTKLVKKTLERDGGESRDKDKPNEVHDPIHDAHIRVESFEHAGEKDEEEEKKRRKREKKELKEKRKIQTVGETKAIAKAEEEEKKPKRKREEDESVKESSKKSKKDKNEKKKEKGGKKDEKDKPKENKKDRKGKSS